MMRLLFFLVFSSLFYSCRVSKNNLKILNEEDSDLPDIQVFFKGKEVHTSMIEMVLLAENDESSIRRDTFYELNFDKWKFRINKDYLSGASKILVHYDNRLFNNQLRKKLTNDSIFFIKRHFILDTGQDDIYLIPVLKGK